MKEVGEKTNGGAIQDFSLNFQMSTWFLYPSMIQFYAQNLPHQRAVFGAVLLLLFLINQSFLDCFKSYKLILLYIAS